MSLPTSHQSTTQTNHNIPIQPPTEIITAYGPHISQSIYFPAEEGRTDTSQQSDCDINVILARYLATGVLDFTNKHEATYGEIDSVSFESAQYIVAEAKSMFADLPSKIREQFNQDPGQFLDFVSDESNLPKMAQMGLLRPERAQEILNPQLSQQTAPATDKGPSRASGAADQPSPAEKPA